MTTRPLDSKRSSSPYSIRKILFQDHVWFSKGRIFPIILMLANILTTIALVRLLLMWVSRPGDLIWEEVAEDWDRFATLIPGA